MGVSDPAAPAIHSASLIHDRLPKEHTLNLISVFYLFPLLYVRFWLACELRQMSFYYCEIRMGTFDLLGFDC